MTKQSKPRVPSGRWVEVCLLVVALAIASCGYLAVLINRTGSLPSSIWLHLGFLAAFVVATHLIVRYFAPYADPILLPATAALNGIGLAVLYRLDLAYGPDQPFYTGYKQLFFTMLGVFLMVLCMFFFRDYRKLRSYTYTSMVIALLLLLSPLLPVLGKSVNGARIWIRVGFSLQPSELAKICLAVFFAGYLMVNRDALSTGGKQILRMRLPRFRDLGPLAIVWLISLAILVFERDLGTSLLIFGLFVVMLYVATNQTSWLLIGAAMFAPAVALAAKTFSHVQKRIQIWLDPLNEALINRRGGSGQLVQGLFGMADGGLSGTGWAQGSPTITPYAQSDFIFATIGEELGMIGACGVLLLYLLIVQRGFAAALRINDSFGKLLATGLAFTLGWQVFVVVGGITRVIPLTGLTLPFIAAGGSSMIANWIILGLLLLISHEARKPKENSQALVDTKEIAIVLDRQAQKEYQANLTRPVSTRKRTASRALPPAMAAPNRPVGSDQAAPNTQRGWGQ